MTKFQALVEAEIKRARARYNPSHSLHEAYAVLWEEVEELWDEIKKKPCDRYLAAVLAEAVQVAAMAQRLVEDVIPEELESTHA